MKDYLIIVVGVAIVLLLTLLLLVSCDGSMKCLEHGYPNTYITRRLEIYCVGQVEGTDVIVPLEEVLREQ